MLLIVMMRNNEPELCGRKSSEKNGWVNVVLYYMYERTVLTTIPLFLLFPCATYSQPAQIEDYSATTRHVFVTE